jgi:hypothetical protein
MNTYIATWCTEGFEHIEDISKYEHWDQEQLVNILASRATQRNPMWTLVRNLMLRARFNPQRQYEIYTFNVDSHVTAADVDELAQQNPQYLVDWIRQHGRKIYSDKIDKAPVIT